jgi:hypothetical protein
MEFKLARRISLILAINTFFGNIKRSKVHEVNCNMTKQEALVALMQGKKITHEYFGSSEYLYMEYGIIRTEEKYSFDQAWDKRTGPEWDTGWKLYGAS